MDMNDTRNTQSLGDSDHPDDLRRIIRQLQEQLQEANQKLEEATMTDLLTGLRNRQYLLKSIHADIAKVHRDYSDAFMGKTEMRPVNADLVFLLVDLDHFKVVNEIYGHAAGNRALIQVREVLESACRESDILIRWGEDEFLIVSRYTNPEQAQIIAERIREKFNRYLFDLGNQQRVALTCSIGAASYPFLSTYPDYLNWEQVIAIADKGLSIAKHSGRDAYVNIMSTAQIAPDRIFQRIHEEIGSLITAGELRIVTSLSDLSQLVFR